MIACAHQFGQYRTYGINGKVRFAASTLKSVSAIGAPSFPAWDIVPGFRIPIECMSAESALQNCSRFLLS